MALYGSTYPLSQREKYFPNENVDFVLNFANKTILQNSMFITGRLVVYSGGNPSAPRSVAIGDDIYFDGHAGAHGLVQTFTTSFSDRVVETFNHYPRWIKMKNTALMASENMSAMSSEAAQLLCWDQQQPATAGENVDCLTARSVMVLPADGEGVLSSAGRAFAFKPDICVNTIATGLPSSVVGEVKLTLQLSSTNQFLYGENAANYDYYLTDLELCYSTIPDSKQVKNVSYTLKQSIKQIINSNNQTLNYMTPIPCRSMSASFIKANSENNVVMDYLTMDPLKNLSRVDWSINDMNQGILEYPLTHTEEMKLNYLMAIRGGVETVQQSIEPQALEAVNKVRGVGLNYLGLDGNIKVSMNILSDASNVDEYAIYIYFIGESAF